jgi:hypothetical protein
MLSTQEDVGSNALPEEKRRSDQKEFDVARKARAVGKIR